MVSPPVWTSFVGGLVAREDHDDSNANDISGCDINGGGGGDGDSWRTTRDCTLRMRRPKVRRRYIRVVPPAQKPPELSSAMHESLSGMTISKQVDPTIRLRKIKATSET